MSFRQGRWSLLELPVLVRRSLIVAWDVAAWLVAFGLFAYVRYGSALTAEMWAHGLIYIASAILLQVVWGIASQSYLGRSRVGSFAEASYLGAAVFGIAVVLAVVFALIIPGFPRGVALATPALALFMMVAGRWTFRVLFRHELRSAVDGAIAAVVYGAGDAGHQVARLVDNADPAPYRIVGFVDDDPGKRFLRVRGYRVLGRGSDVVEIARAHNAEKVILAISSPDAQLIQGLSDRCKQAGLRLVVVPPVREMIGGQVHLGQLREVNVLDLLGRRPIETDLRAISDYVTGHVVLVTGAGGSIGSELARQVHSLGPSKLVLLDRDESALHGVQLSLYGSGLLDTDDMVLCSIRDHEALAKVFETHRPDVVFHAAALKHLPMLERFPAEGWKTNVVGTLNVLRCAHQVGVAHLVNISTDKAADPTSVLGQTKRLAERLTAWYAVRYGVRYLSVRFGNVLGSRGSVLHTFKKQIERGGPVTVTHPDVTRFFMTIPESCELVLQAGAIGGPGDVLVLDMGEPVRIVDVAHRLIEDSGREVEMRFTGLRKGEKLDEVLLSDAEHGEPSDHPLITRVSVPPLSPGDVLRPDENTESIPRLVQALNETEPRPGKPETDNRMEVQRGLLSRGRLS